MCQKMDIQIIQAVKTDIVSNYDNQYAVHIELDNTYYSVIISNSNIDTPIVFDSAFYDFITTHKLYFSKYTGYLTTSNKLVHRIIAEKGGFQGLDDKSLSIDHINWFKLDNRVCNLRMATQAQQNSNRASRSDKEKPHNELIDIGVDDLPRHVRWDTSENKFIIEKHPVLLQEVEDGFRKKPALSGTKKQGLSIVEKYNDIIDKLNMLDLRHDDAHKEFVGKRDALRNEYFYITEFVKSYFLML